MNNTTAQPLVKKRVTLSDVAKHAGVSYAAASTVLNKGRGNARVSPATRARIEASAAELKYHRNAIGLGLAQGRMNAIGLMFFAFESALVTNPYAVGIMEGVLTAASKADNTVTIYTLPESDGQREITIGRDGRTDGCVIIDPVAGAPVVNAVANTGHPLVAIASRVEDHGVHAVDIDNFKGSQIAIEHLIGLGHTRIAFISGGRELRHDLERADAFHQTMAAAGLRVPADYVQHCNPALSPAEATRRLLSLPNPPTAIYGANDHIAVHVIDDCRENGIAVPGDISVIGFDDAPMAQLAVPKLTTIRQPLAKIGAFATDLLLRLIGGTYDEPAVNHLFEPELIVRGSTAPPR